MNNFLFECYCHIDINTCLCQEWCQLFKQFQVESNHFVQGDNKMFIYWFLVLQMFIAWPVFAWHQDYGKLVDGQQSDISKFPYQVALQLVGKLTCGGSIIDKKWILTAAHCTFG